MSQQANMPGGEGGTEGGAGVQRRRDLRLRVPHSPEPSDSESEPLAPPAREPLALLSPAGARPARRRPAARAPACRHRA